ncbi:MAG: 50S ribosomal protein L2 [Cyanobacteria bacterium]|nr:50S ribosomal protein L2 [Cyanobacteriota bacterium]MDA1020959.1 50S ribosomal protein L2 [Cyanobacteriota bacterium]
MALKKYKPTTPGSRGTILLDRSDVTTNKPERTLTSKLRKHTGRNNTGKITCRHKGGGNKKKYRDIDFKRNKFGIKAKVSTIEYDPNRNVHIALLVYADGEKRYILCPKGLTIGAIVESGPEAEIKSGNALAIRDLPLGSTIHNIELTPGKGAQMVRSAGNSAQLLAKEDELATLRLPSGEMRRVKVDCMATLGELGNSDWKNIVWGKAGRRRKLGIRPTVRGSAMNPVDHPHGGGEGKAPIGGIPKSFTGKRLGRKTRKPKKASSKMIITNRKGKKISSKA